MVQTGKEIEMASEEGMYIILLILFKYIPDIGIYLF